MRAWLTCGGIALLISVLAAPVTAQDDPAPTGPAPLTINYVEGRVDVARDTGVLPAQAPDLLDDGDRLITASGRAELVFADGSVVHVDHDTDVRIDGEARLRIVRGHIIVRTSAALEGDGLVVGTPAGLVRFSPRGEYDVSASDLDGDTIVGTMRGQAALLMASTEVPVGPEDVLHIDPRDRKSVV